MNNERLLPPPQRVGFLDEVRGLCLLLMVLYHGAYDIIYIFGMDIPLFHWPVMNILQSVFAGIFILISGACCRFSRSNLRRGLMALAVGLAMTAVTYFFMPLQTIRFGILHFMGCGMVLFYFIKKTLDKLPAFWGLLLMASAFFMTWYIPFGTAVMGRVAMPAFLYRSRFLYPLGFPGAGFASADYFPLVPWIFCFLAGSYLGLFFTNRTMPSSLYQTRFPFLAAVGRRSLLVYVLHQPVLYGFLSAVWWILGMAGLA